MIRKKRLELEYSIEHHSNCNNAKTMLDLLTDSTITETPNRYF